jgi:hypothetical protein
MPKVTIKVCPRGYVCQAVRAPGSNVTLAPCTPPVRVLERVGRCEPPFKMYRQEYELEFLDDAEICNPSRELNFRRREEVMQRLFRLDV